VLHLLQLLNVQPGTPKRRSQQPRWVPYTHSNGLAIYQHQGKDSSTASGKGGEEYMVRCCHMLGDVGEEEGLHGVSTGSYVASNTGEQEDSCRSFSIAEQQQ
jgi:hypothetical protein